MRFQRILQQLRFRPWHITGEAHSSIVALVASKLAGSNESGFEDFFTQRPPFAIDESGVAHIHLFGTLGQGLSQIEKSCGATDYDDVCKELEASRGARALMLHVDSPGGMCEGCSETAAVIDSIAIPKIAFTRGEMCSAAYDLSCGCDAIYCTPSAVVGCIGTIMPWVDESALWEKMGISSQPITNDGADLKSTGYGPSLTDDQRAYLTELANDFANQFKGHVATHRDVDPIVWRGGAYAGSRAQMYRLVDGLMSEAGALATLGTGTEQLTP